MSCLKVLSTFLLTRFERKAKKKVAKLSKHIQQKVECALVERLVRTVCHLLVVALECEPTMFSMTFAGLRYTTLSRINILILHPLLSLCVSPPPPHHIFRIRLLRTLLACKNLSRPTQDLQTGC